MATSTNTSGRVSVYSEHVVDGTKYFLSSDSKYVSLQFVMDAYRSDSMYWTKPMDMDTMRVMVENSTILGIYRMGAEGDDLAGVGRGEAGQQVGMARFITDHVTHAYLTDVYVLPEVRGKGLGKILIENCNDFIGRLPYLRKAMLATSNPKRNATFYQEQLGMHVPVQDQQQHLILVRRGLPNI